MGDAVAELPDSVCCRAVGLDISVCGLYVVLQANHGNDSSLVPVPLLGICSSWREGTIHLVRILLVSVQRSIFTLSFLEDGNVRIGVFPKGEEVLVGSPDFGNSIVCSTAI